MRLGVVLLLNLLLGGVWYALQPAAGPGDYILGFSVGFVLLALLYRPYGRRTWAATAFLIFLLWNIVLSSVRVAQIVLSPNPALRQGITAIPMKAQTDFEIAALATSITLTPGTLSVDVAVTQAADGSKQHVLYVHSLVLDDPEALRHTIQSEFERRILRFTRAEEST